MKEIFKKNWQLLTLIILSILVIWPLLSPGYFSHQDDLQVMRVFEMRKCFSDLQIPCRWVPDMGYGNGFPLFNYYSVFPYYLGALFSFFLTFISSAKLLFFIPLFFGGLAMYFLGKELFGKLGGYVSGVLYIFAPYRALDSYVRGAVAESFALFLIPLVFLFSFKLIKSNKFDIKYLFFLSLSLGGFLTSHNIMTIMFMPIFLIWTFFWVVIDKKYNSILPLLVSLTLGFGLAAFFILPAFFEKNLVSTDTLTRGDLNFRAHFVTVDQLFFSRFWGYGAAASNTHQDTISYQIGWPHWWLALVALLISIYFGFLHFFSKNQVKTKRVIFLSLFFSVVFLISVFMMHNKSAFIWERLSILQFAQFPWRFLSVSIFSSSLLGGFVVFLLKGKFQLLGVILIILITVILNSGYFHPDQYYFNLTDREKLVGTLWEDQQKASLLDYLPKGAIEPREAAPHSPILNSGKAWFADYQNNSKSFQFAANVQENSTIELPIFDFPNWEVFTNGVLISHTSKNYLGRIQIQLTPGSYLVKGYFGDTTIRIISNFITLAAFILLFVIVLYGKFVGYKKA